MATQSDPRRFSFYLEAMHDLGQSLAVHHDRVEQRRSLRESLYRITGTFAVARGLLLTSEMDGHRLTAAVAKGFRPGRRVVFELGAAQARALSSSTRPFHLHMPTSGFEEVADRIRSSLGRVNMHWAVPLGTGAALTGLLLMGPRISGEPLSTLELSVLEEMAATLALRLEDSRARRQLSGQLRELKKMNRQMRQIYLETVRALARAVDGKAGPEPSHSLRVAALAEALARRLRLSREARETLYLAGLLHDIGKQVINHEILSKPAPLDPEDWNRLRQHPEFGCELINHLRFPWGDVAEIIRHHHERPDGSGYPDRLRGDQISLEARILMMAEAFDSMTSDQPWRPKLGFQQVVEQIQENLGLQFEPRVVQALCEVVEAGLTDPREPPEFIPHLQSSFNPLLVRRLLNELRRRLAQTPAGGKANVIDATSLSDA